MKRLAIALIVLALAPAEASAQMSAALGKPLPDAKLEVGTATVRVINGSPDKPHVGIDVTMIAGDESSTTARTDAQGRATFNGLEVGQQYVAQVKTEDGEASSEPFAVPESGGVRLMLSPVGWKGPSGGAPAMAGGMPDPRQMSGIPRGEQSDPAGRLTVRVVRGTLAANAVGVPVYLIGYAGDGSMFVREEKTDGGGRVVFRNLEIGRVAYYVMTTLERDAGIDRLQAGPIVMFPQVGVRVMLAGEKAGSGKPAVDDLLRGTRGGALPAGQVRVSVQAARGAAREVALVDVATGKTVTTAPVRRAVPDAGDVQGEWDPVVSEERVPTGELSAAVMQATAQGMRPLPNTTIALRRVEDEDEPATDGAQAEGDAAQDGPAAQEITNASGVARFTGLEPETEYEIVATVHGKEVASEPFVVPEDKGLRATATVMWQVAAPFEARFEGVPAGAVYAGKVISQGESYYTGPFLMTADRGASALALVFPRVVFRFHLAAAVDDKYLGFQGQLTIQNWSYFPYDPPGDDGLVIPLPEGFIGAAVAQEYESRVSIDPDRGFIWRGALPPGGAEFRAGFSLEIDDGEIDFDMPLPYGAFQSSLVFTYSPGMEVNHPSGVRGQLKKNDSGKQFYVIDNISIPPNKRIEMGVRGLPQPPSWQGWIKLALGAMVILLCLWAIAGIAGAHRRAAAPDAGGGRADRVKGEREELYDALVALEQNHQRGEVDEDEYRSERKTLMLRLEATYQGERKGKGPRGERRGR